MVKKHLLIFSIFLLIIFSFSFVSAPLDENVRGDKLIKHESISSDLYKTPDGQFKSVYYLTIKNVLEDGIYKNLSEARSLKNSGIIVEYLETDEGYPIEILDYNYTSITLKLNPDGKIDYKKDIPIRIWERNNTKEEKYFEDVKNGTKNDTTLKDKYKETYDNIIDLKENKVELSQKELTKTYDLGFNKILEIGENSTTIQYNFNATFQNVNMWAYDCDDSGSNTLFGTDPVLPNCGSGLTSQTANSALDTSNDVRLTTGVVNDELWFFSNSSINKTIDRNDITLINWTWEGYSGNDLCGGEIYLYNFTSTNYNLFTSFGVDSDTTKSMSSSAIQDYVSSSNQTAMLVLADTGGCTPNNEILTDYVKFEVTYTPHVNVTLSTPLNNSNFSSTLRNFVCNSSSTSNVQLNNATLYIYNNDGSLNGTNSTSISGTTNSTNFSYNFTGDGTFKWNCLVNNTAGVSNWSSSNFTITIDSTPPNINIITPTNNTNSTDINLNINYTTSDTYLSNCWYSNDTYSINTSITCGENITTITWIQGNHNLTIWVNDTFGNVNSSQVSFFIDNIPPTLEIIYPEDGGSYSINSVSLNYTASDSGVGLSSCWYKNNTGSNITISCGTNTTINQPIDGTYTIYMWANDTLNNVVSHSHTWTISTSAPNVNLQKPDNNYWFNNQTNIYFNFTASDTNGIDTCRLYGNWTGSFILNESKTFSGDTSVNISEGFFVKNITDGFYKWSIWCNDTNNDGTFATLNRTFGIDTIYPNLNLSLPQNITYTTNQLTLNFSATDTNRNTCWYNINNTQNITLTNCNNISLTANQGGSILRLFVNDSANNVNSTNISFFVDSILPTLTITTNFTNNSYLNYNNSIDFNLTITDTNLNTCWYNINGSNQTFTCGSNLTLNVSEGLKTLIVYANDSLNNQNSSQISFTSDVTYPLIQNLTATPVGNTQNVDFSFNTTDINYNNSFYTIFNSSGGVDTSTVENTSLTCTSGNTCSGSDTVSGFATFNLTIYSRDKSGNENSSTKSFTTTAGVSSSGGGGGGILNETIIIVIENASWVMYSSELGGNVYNLEMTSFATRSGEIYFYNNNANETKINLICSGDLCEYLKLDKYNITLPVGKNIPTVVKFSIVIAKEIENKKYVANIIGTDQYGSRNFITITSNVGGLGVLGKIISNWISIDTPSYIPIPYLLFNTLLYITLIFLLYFFIFKKVSGGKVWSIFLPFIIISIILIFL